VIYRASRGTFVRIHSLRWGKQRGRKRKSQSLACKVGEYMCALSMYKVQKKYLIFQFFKGVLNLQEMV